MKLGRFQLALNHDDPNFIIQGLNEFTEKILTEHNATESFGYYGRSLLPYQTLHGNSPMEIKGLLKDYISSSPQIEELHILWKISDRNENPDLILAHTHCFAAILHCAKSDEGFCNRIVTRILSEYSRTVTNQLTLGQQSVIHATLGLLLAMCASSPQNSRDTYHKLLSHLAPLQTLLQKGKIISTELSGIRVQTDSRHLIILLVLMVLYHCDASVGNELISHKGLFNRVVNGIHKDNSHTIFQVIQNVSEILVSPSVPYQIKVNLIDASFLSKLLELKDDQNVESSKQLLLEYCHLLVESGNRRGEGKYNPMNRMTLVVKTLSPHLDIFHKELISILLKAKPFLLSRCLNAIPISWDQPTLSPSFLTSLSYLCFLLEVTDLDHSLTCRLSSSEADPDKEAKTFVSTLCSSLLPSGFLKKDLSRILQHQSPLLRRMGLMVYLRVVQRIQRVMRGIDKTGKIYIIIQSHLTSALTNLLPDVQLLLAIRTKAVAICGNKLFSSISEDANMKDLALETSAITSVESADLEQAFYFLHLTLMLFESILTILPGLFQAQHPNFDFTRLLDDIIPWPASLSVQDALHLHFSKSRNEPIPESYCELIYQTIKVIRVATLADQCNWFGSKTDCIKLLTNLLVSPNWDGLKRNSLQKLFLLSSLRTCPFVDQGCCLLKDISEFSSELIDMILSKSELFQAHGNVVVEMATEQSSWLQVMHRSSALSQRNWIILIEILLRLSHHWDLELCFHAFQLPKETPDFRHLYSFANGAIPFSPVLYGSIHLLSLNFQLFRDDLPKYIQNHIDEISSSLSDNFDHQSFFQKYIDGFRSELLTFFHQLVFTCLPWVSNPHSYLMTLSSVSQFLSRGNNCGSSTVDFFPQLISLLNEKESIVSGTLPASLSTIQNLHPNDDISLPILTFMSRDTFSKTHSIPFLDSWWALIASILVTWKENLSDTLFNWLSSCIGKEMGQIYNKTSNQKVGLISLSLRLIHKVSDSLPQSKLKKRKSTNLPLVDEERLSKELCRKLTCLVIELFVSADDPRQLINSLNTPYLLNSFGGNNLFLIECFRQVVITAAVCQMKKKLSSSQTDQFWNSIFEQFTNIQRGTETLDLFCLSWSLQSIVNEPSLRTSLINYCIGEGVGEEGYALTSLSQFKKNQSSVVYVQLSPVFHSLLKSGGMDSLYFAAEKLCLDFLRKSDVSDSLLSNALCHVLFSLAPTDVILTNYCDVLSLGAHSQTLDYLSSLVLVPAFFDHLDRIQFLVSIFPFIPNSQNQFINLLSSPLEKLVPIDLPISKRRAITISNLLFKEWLFQDELVDRGALLDICLQVWDLIENFLLEKDCMDHQKVLILNFRKVFVEIPNSLPIILSLFLNRDKLQWSKFLFTGLYPILLCTTDLQCNESWVEIFSNLLLSVLDETMTALKLLKNSDSCSLDLDHNCETLLSLIEICDTVGLNSFHISKDLQISLVSTINKCLKLCLKYGLDKILLLNFLLRFSNFVQGEANFFAFLHQQDRDNELESVLSCHQLLEMLISHSKFISSLKLADEVRLPLLRFILFTLSSSVSGIEILVPLSCLEFLMQSLFPLYQATTQYSDRLIFRILHLSQDAVNRLALAMENFENRSIFSLPLPFYVPNVGQDDNFIWVTHALTPPVVYNTLTRFPLRRTATPAIFDLEPSIAIGQRTQPSQQKEPADDSENSSESEEDELVTKVDIYPIDWHREAPNSLDPSYWLPALHCCLSNCVGLSMRVFANCGALALTIAGLGSECPIIRTYAKSCLQIVYEVLQTQTPDKDSAFKERPQLILLVSFIRNYYTEYNPTVLTDQFKLPVSQSIFLARAALHLLQPQHSLFSSVNKYLLSKPYCDIKDVPLYDMLVMESDIQDDSNQRVAALRLLRDCIVSNQDHLNMCRKNAYPRLMMCFMLFSKDIKIGHAIFDIFDKALVSSPTAARYLIERCAFISWLQQLSSPINGRQTEDTRMRETNEYSEDHQEDSSISLIMAAPWRLISRVVCLLRKSLGVLLLLHNRGIDTLQHQKDIFLTALSLVRDILLIRTNREFWTEFYLLHDFLKQLILLLWDLTLAAASHGRDSKLEVLWNVDDIVQFADLCQELGKSLNKIDSQDMELSLLSLLAFRKSFTSEYHESVSGSRLMELTMLHLVLGQMEKCEEPSSYCLLTGSKFHSSKPKESNSIYLSPTNLILNDNFATVNYTVGHASIDLEGGESNVERCIAQVADRCWSTFSEFNLLNTPLPSKLGKNFLVISTARSVLLILCSEKTICNSLQYTRWALLMKKVFFDSPYRTSSLTSDLPNQSADRIVKARVCQRLFSFFDEGYFEDYSESYDQYLLGYHYAVIGLISFLNHLELFRKLLESKETIGFRIWEGIQNSIGTLLRTSPCSQNEIREQARHLCDHAKYYWNSDDTTRIKLFTIISLNCDFLSTLLTLIDRDSNLPNENIEQILSTCCGDQENGNYIVDILNMKAQKLATATSQMVSSLETPWIKQNDSISFETAWMEENESNSSLVVGQLTLNAFLRDNNIDLQQCNDQMTGDETGLELLLKKMNTVATEYSLIGQKLIPNISSKTSLSSLPPSDSQLNENKRTSSHDSLAEVETKLKKRRTFTPLQYVVTCGRRINKKKKSN